MPSPPPLPTSSPEKPTQRADSTSDFSFDESTDVIPGRSKDPSIRQIRQRTTPMGRVLLAVCIIGAPLLTWIYWKREESHAHRMDAIEAAGMRDTVANMLQDLRGLYDQTSYPDVKVRIIRNLAHFRDHQAMTIFIKGLDEAGIVRRAAALALARIGPPDAEVARPVLLRVLSDCDEKDRPQVVWALTVLGETRASDAILEMFLSGHLQNQPDFDPHFVTQALGQAKLSDPKLIGHKDASVRQLVAQALGEVRSESVILPLQTMTKDSQPDVARDAIVGLVRVGTPEAATQAARAMENRPNLESQIIENLRRTAGAQALVQLIFAVHRAPTRHTLAELIKRAHDPHAADALLRLSEDADANVRLEAAAGLAELGDRRAAAPLIELAGSADERIAKTALAHLSEVATEGLVPTLIDLMAEFPQRKSLLIRALGGSNSAKAGPILEKELKGPDSTAAAISLGRLRYGPALPKLITMASRPRTIDFSTPSAPRELQFLSRWGATQGIALFGATEAENVLLTLLEDVKDDLRIREAAADGLGLFKGPDSVANALAKLKHPSTPLVEKTLIVRSLWDRQNPEVTKTLMTLMRADHTDPPLRRAAAIGIGMGGKEPLGVIEAEALKNPVVKREAAFAAMLGGGQEAAFELLGMLEQERGLGDWLQAQMDLHDHDVFSRITAEALGTGRLWERLRTAEILKEGRGQTMLSAPWHQALAALARGWEGPGGVTPQEIRAFLFSGLTKGDETRQQQAARILAALDERGVLISVRDSAGPGSFAARIALRGLGAELKK